MAYEEALLCSSVARLLAAALTAVTEVLQSGNSVLATAAHEHSSVDLCVMTICNKP